MKLSEIAKRPRRQSGESFTTTLEPAGGIYGDVEVEIDFEGEGPSHTDHGDNHTFREHHPMEVEVTGVTLVDDVPEYDDDGDKTGKIVGKKGSDATKLPGWTSKDDAFLEKQAYKHVEDLMSRGRDDY